VNARLLRWLPPALLLIVALNQHRLAWSEALTPWCGGGFGMFSTNDGRAARHVHAWALGPGTLTELIIPAALARRAENAGALPSDAQLRSLARALGPYARASASGFEAPASIRIDVFTTRYDESTLAPSGGLLRSAEFAVDARP
jgi:hypothetical protein